MLCIVVVVVSSYFYPGQRGPTFTIVPGIVILWGLASDLIKRRGTTSVTSIYILLLLLQCFNWKTSSGFWLSLLVGTLHRGEPMVVILSATDIIVTCSTLSPSNLFLNNNLRYYLSTLSMAHAYKFLSDVFTVANALSDTSIILPWAKHQWGMRLLCMLY